MVLYVSIISSLILREALLLSTCFKFAVLLKNSVLIPISVPFYPYFFISKTLKKRAYSRSILAFLAWSMRESDFPLLLIINLMLLILLITMLTLIFTFSKMVFSSKHI